MVSQLPLSDEEIQVLRGLIDDHLFEQRLRQQWYAWWRSWKAAVTLFAATILFAVEIVNAYYNLKGH